MCKTFYKYFLITGTSFFACGGLYLVCLTDFLWPHTKTSSEKDKYNWRHISFITGFLGLVIFTPGLVVVIRARVVELKYYGFFLIVPLIVTLVILAARLVIKEDMVEATSWYLLGLALGTLAIIINVFLFQYELTIYRTHQLLTETYQKHQNENSV